MAKGKGKKGKGKKKPEVDPNALTEVDKTFYELQIADLNKKLARLRSLTEELQVHNEDLQQNLTQLDGDRNDVIIFLKRMLQEKSDEINDLQDRITGLEETRTTETTGFTEKVTRMEDEYKQMHEQLTSEIKLLTGKLNALEEFRLQRDDLMKKFETQEKEMEGQEAKHKNELYEIERKFIIGKDRLKKEMERRLIQLSNEFQDVTEVRIASTTHRVIRENIAINNELDTMLTTHQHYYNENEKLKKNNKKLKLEVQLHEKEKNKALQTVNVQLSIISKFTEEHEKLTTKVKRLKELETENFKLDIELTDLKRTNDRNKIEIRILEQNLHAGRCDRTLLRTELSHSKDEAERLSNIIYHAVMSIKVALQLEPGEPDDLIKRKGLLQNLLNLMNKAQEEKLRKPSLESIGSLTAMYATGDLGFIPKPGPYRKQVPVWRTVESQVGESLEELITEQLSETGSFETGRRGTRTESIVMTTTTGPKTPSQKALDSERTDEKLVFMESSEPSSVSSASASALKLEMSATPSAIKINEEMKRTASKSATKMPNAKPSVASTGSKITQTTVEEDQEGKPENFSETKSTSKVDIVKSKSDVDKTIQN